MAKKVIAIGNRLMMDDAVGVLIVENIKKDMEYRGIEVIIGETNIDYAFSKLNNHDEFYIVDSTCYGTSPGTVILKTIENVKIARAQSYAIHSLNLIDLINLNKLDIKGYLVGIEIENIDINFGLSNALQEKFDAISKEVLSLII